MAERELKLCFVGDTMIGRHVTPLLRKKHPNEILGELAPILRGSDGVVTNLECPITSSKTPGRRTWKAFRMRADPESVAFLTAANVRFVSLANNHILDFGDRGLGDTINALDAETIAHGGAGMTRESAQSPVVLDFGGERVGFICLTDRMKRFGAVDGQCGTNFVALEPDNMELKEKMRRWVDQLKDSNARTIVLSAHFGPDFQQSPSSSHQEFARFAIEIGIDIVHGHSAHVFQGIEIFKNRLILYDTGNFFDDYFVFPLVRNNESFIFQLSMVDGQICKLDLRPFFRTDGELRLANGTRFTRMSEELRRKSMKFGTVLNVHSDRLELHAGDGDQFDRT